jgi:hypothetical protein
MSTVTVKRFVMPNDVGSGAHFSIRRRSDGIFQLFHDDPFVGTGQSYEFEDLPISGLYADLVF